MWLMFWVACREPVPEDYDTLISYMVEHFEDEMILEDGMEQLYSLFDESLSKKVSKGRRIDGLTSSAIEQLEPGLDTQPELLGIIKSRDYPYTVNELAHTNFLVHPRDVFTNPDAINERSYIGDPQCFVDLECDELEYEATLQRFLPLNIDATIYFHTQIRWIETDLGPVFIQKRWLTDDPEVSADWIHLNHGYSLAITFPLDGEEDLYAKQIEHIWGDIALGDLPIPEEGAFMVANDVLGSILRQFEDYLDERD